MTTAGCIEQGNRLRFSEKIENLFKGFDYTVFVVGVFRCEAGNFENIRERIFHGITVVTVFQHFPVVFVIAERHDIFRRKPQFFCELPDADALAHAGGHTIQPLPGGKRNIETVRKILHLREKIGFGFDFIIENRQLADVIVLKNFVKIRYDGIAFIEDFKRLEKEGIGAGDIGGFQSAQNRVCRRDRGNPFKGIPQMFLLQKSGKTGIPQYPVLPE